MPPETVKQISNNSLQQNPNLPPYIPMHDLNTYAPQPDKQNIKQKQRLLFEPASIFGKHQDGYSLDYYIKIKMLDKPKDTLAQVLSKKVEFESYINQRLKEQKLQNLQQKTLINQHRDPSRSEFYEHTFEKQIPHGTVVIVKITPSIRYKCNIVVSNILGQIIKYYPNVLLIKKGGKILKVLEQYHQHFIFVLDYAFNYAEYHSKYFLPLFRKPISLQYSIMNSESHQIKNSTQLSQLKQKLPIQLIENLNTLKILRIQEEYSHILKIIGQVELKIFQIIQEQNKLLEKIRGKIEDQSRIAYFDLMIVNIWKQGKCQPQFIQGYIIALFDMKAEAVKNLMPQETQSTLHLPFRMKKEQNCAHCLSKNLRQGKPKRTYWICKVCSSQRQKSFYLCKKCFGTYHQNPNIPIFKKSQKKTKKILKIKRNLKNNALKPNKKKKKKGDEAQESSESAVKDGYQCFAELDRLQEQFFQKIQNLIQDGQQNNLKSSQFYLTMLLNTNILMLNTLQNKNASAAPSQI